MTSRETVLQVVSAEQRDGFVHVVVSSRGQVYGLENPPLVVELAVPWGDRDAWRLGQRVRVLLEVVEP